MLLFYLKKLGMEYLKCIMYGIYIVIFMFNMGGLLILKSN